MKVVFVKSKNQWTAITVSQILWIGKVRGKPNYLGIHLEEDVIETKMSMIQFKENLPADEFIQIHKSFIVNKFRISSVSRDLSSLKIIEKRFPISRSFAQHVTDSCNLL